MWLEMPMNLGMPMDMNERDAHEWGYGRKVRIRTARTDDLDILRDIERAAGRPFRDIGMPEIADDEPPSLETLGRYEQAGRAWVATDSADRPIAYLITDPVDGNVHIEQVSVHPDHARQRIGRSLIDHVAELARVAGFPALTLCTFAEVPWNAPYYARCGFRPLTEAELSPGLRALRRREAELGLDHWPRLCMRRDL